MRKSHDRYGRGGRPAAAGGEAVNNQPTSQHKEIPDFPGYWVERNGKVWSCWIRAPLKGGGTCTVLGKDPRELKLCLRDGYYIVTLCKGGRHCTRNVHRLVLEVFSGPRLDGQECRHLDGNRLNNHFDNLTWGTRKKNARDRNEHGRTACGEHNGSRKHPERLRRGNNHHSLLRPQALSRGEKHYNAKLTDADLFRIRKMLSDGESYPKIARAFGVTVRTIYKINKGLSWKRL